MKVTNWCRKLSAAVLAAGIWVPGVSYAVNIPLGDPSFDAFAVPAFPGGLGYAYSDTYRPTSAWVDDLDSPGPPDYVQDDGNSNWLYDAGYAEGGSTARRRPAPRSGNQAMHGLGYYNAQETSAVFEAGRTYTFSVWAQGDDDSTLASSRVFLYIFDGSVPFSEANALTFRRFAPDTGDFLNRARTMTAAESQANWRQISLSHTVLPGAPEIGHSVGVGFWPGSDGALDDATLTSVIPEPTTIILVGLSGVALVACRRRRE
jgi:PEP-CTERM motif